MNTIYRIVWNAITCRWIVASELAKGRTKCASTRSVAVTAVLFAGVMASGGAFALSSAGTSSLIVNDTAFGTPDAGNCNGVGGDGSGSASNGYIYTSCSAAAFSGYNNSSQTGSVVVADNSLSVGGYQFINGKNSSGNALTIKASGANILMNNGKVSGLANGTASTDSVNVSQLTPVVTALGGGAAINGATGVVTAPSYALANANSIAGTAGAATNVGSGFSKVDTALGTLNTAVTTAQTTANTANTTANKGWNLSADAGATSQNIAPGGTANFAAGTNATVTRSGNTVTMGVVNNPTFSGMLTANGGLTVGAGQTVSMGGNKVTNVASGALTAASTDAVNGSQLYATNQQVTQNTSDIAGNTTSITNMQNSITSGTTGLVQQAAAGADLTVGKSTDGAAVNFADKNGNTRTLKNVTAGVAATDAVNMSQLNATNANVAANTSNIAGNTTAITNLGTRVTTTEGNISTINTTIAGMNGQLVDAVMYDSAAHDSVTLGNAGTPVQVTNVKSGALSAASTDAVNGSQLYATNQQVAQNTSDIAGNTTAIAGNTTSISNITNQINSGTVGLVQQAAAGADLTVGKDADGVAVNFADKNGNTRTLKNVTAGVAAADAVNMSQLNATNANVAGNTTSITNLQNSITSGTTGMVQQVAAGADLTVGKDTDGVAVNFADKNGNTRTLKNVTAGVADTDTVNMSQLNATNANVAVNTSNIAGNTTSITNLGTRVTTTEGNISTINTTIAGMSGQLVDAVMYDSAAHDSVTLGNAGTPVQVTNVKSGALSAASTDAVNGSQLYATNQQVAQNTSDIAGNTASINTISTQINSGTIGLVQQAAAGADLTVGKDTDGVAVNFADKNGNTRTLKNVTAGVADTDAVNMSQLNTTNANVTRVEGKADQQGTTTASSLGGGASYNSTTGGISAPSYTLHNADGTTTTANDVGTAVTNMDGRVAQNTSDIAGNTTAINTISTQINSGTIGLVQQAAAGADLTVGKDTDGVAVNFADKNGNTRTLKNVAAGVADTDAVNMSQLNTTNANVTRVEGKADQQGTTTASSLGGGASYNSTTGAISAPSYSVHNADGSTTTVNNVGHAITNLDGRVTQNTTDISSINTTINGMNGRLADAVMYDSAAHDKVTLGNAGTPVQLSNVKDGALSATSSDAVNGSQLYATNQQVAQNTGDIANINSTINTMNTVGLKYVQVNSTAAGANAAGTESVAVGGNSKASAANAVAIGNGAQASQANSVALGAGSTTAAAVKGTTSGSIAGDQYAYAGSAPTGTVSMGSAGNERTVTNVAAGEVSATSTDAVNGSQLNATNQAVNKLGGRMTNVETAVNNLAGNVSNSTDNLNHGQAGMFQVSKDSKGTQPAASGSKSTAGGNSAVASGTNSTALGNAALASADNSVALGANSVADRSNTVSVGSAGQERQVTNVAAGTANTDAVNVGQLKAAGVMNADGSTNTAVTYDSNPDGSTSVTLNGGGEAAVIHNVAPGTSATDAATVGQVQQAADWSKSYTDQQVRNMGRQVNGGVASAMAMSAIPQALANGGHSIGAGVGSFRGQSSVAVSMSAMSATGKFAVKLNLSATTQGEAGVGVGASYNW